MAATSRVNELKQTLLKENPVTESDDVTIDKIKDVLKALDETDITLDILSSTMIGKAVTPLKTHAILGPQAKSLIKKWKQIAKGSANQTKMPPESDKSKGNGSKAERRDSANSNTEAELEWQHLPPLRQNICKKFYDLLLKVKPVLVKAGINATAVDRLIAPRAVEVEAALTEKYREPKAYGDKARSLVFNLKKNTALCQELILGQVEAEELVKFSSEQLASAETREKRASEAKKLIDSKRLDWDQANEEKINEMCGIKGDLLKASLFTCGRCKSVKTTSTQKQTRSADEPMTVFVLCLNCGNRWKC